MKKHSRNVVGRGWHGDRPGHVDAGKKASLTKLENKKGKIHTKKWDRCTKAIKKKQEHLPESKKVNPYAVCTKSIGYNESIRPEHQRKNNPYNPDEVDNVQAKVIELEIENDYQIYRSKIEPTYKNLVNKMAAQTYDPEKANKAFYNVITDYSRQKRVDFGPTNKDTREYLAERMRLEFEAEAKLGNYDDMLYKKYRDK